MRFKTFEIGNFKIKRVFLCAMILILAAGGCSREAPEPQEKPKVEPASHPTEKSQDTGEPDLQASSDLNAELERLLDEILSPAKPDGEAPSPPQEKAEDAGEKKAEKSELKPKTYKELIIGKWSMSRDGREATMEFRSDGTATISTSGQTMDATYSWDSEESFTMTMSMTGPDGQTHEQSGTVTVNSLDDSSMTLVFKRGDHEEESSFTRV